MRGNGGTNRQYTFNLSILDGYYAAGLLFAAQPVSIRTHFLIVNLRFNVLVHCLAVKLLVFLSHGLIELFFDLEALARLGVVAPAVISHGLCSKEVC